MAGKTGHPAAEILIAVADGESSDALTSEHIRTCPICARRVAELRATRDLLADVGTVDVRAPRDLASRAVGRLRLQRTAVGNVNEVFAAMRALFRGLAELFGGVKPPDSPSPGGDERASHG